MHKNLIIGLHGTKLIKEERRWLKEKPPLGVILFARNIENPEQVKSLLGDVRDCTGDVTWAVIDEEGGRVNRIPWLPFSDRRPASEYGRLIREDSEAVGQAVYQDSLRIGQTLAVLGFTHNCAPVLDVFHPEGHGIIGERAYAADPYIVSELGVACMRGLSDAGIEAVG
ncbi:MAG: glycoside hydrolase family 3 N-terminal domain-containing protein, partial [Mariprofundaceae bacterium]|nr:glycoside hydrolase family 3 N-terminal domain-containing protein [Mariprofundaceae bacterium]